jgi:hypothetical protein
MMPSDAQKVWRDGIAPLLSTKGLQALRKALVEDDKDLVQGATCSPPPLNCVKDWNVEAACPLGICLWKGDGLRTVGEVDRGFARLCYEADLRLGETAVTRWWLLYIDDTPRAVMRLGMIEEVDRELNRRLALPAMPPADDV